jgi:uncharacterized protein (UPF0333 family)
MDMVMCLLAGLRDWKRLKLASRGQTSLEYMLMIAVIFTILTLVIAMTAYVDTLGASLGGTIDTTRAQVIDWILT